MRTTDPDYALRLVKLVGGVFLLAPVALTVIFSVPMFFAGDPCANAIQGRWASPQGDYEAIVFERNCGATTGFSSQVSVVRHPSSSNIEGSGNVFVATTDHGAAPAAPYGGPELRLRWASPERLIIAHHRAVQVHFR